MPEFKAAARKYTARALRVLASIMDRASVSPSARVKAAEALLDRGWGKASQEVLLAGVLGSVTADAGTVAKMTREEQVDVGRRMIFLLEAAARAASNEAKPAPRPVRRRIRPEELNRG